MKYYPGQGILFDTNTGHYQIDDYPKDVRQKAKDQAKRAFEGVTPEEADRRFDLLNQMVSYIEKVHAIVSDAQFALANP